MRGWSPGRLARIAVGALLTLLAGSLALSGGSALAGCDHPGPGLAHFEQLVSAGAMPEAEPMPSERPKPCSGPMCSKPPAAPPVMPVTAAFGVEPWACLATPEAAVSPNPAPLPPPEREARPDRRAASIFHPPRSSSLG